MSNNFLINKQRIFFFTPYYKQNRGNATTAKRLVKGLKEASLQVTVFAYEEETWNHTWQELFEQADLYHVLHLRRFASWQNEHQLNLSKPYVLTSGGTDVNEDLKNEAAAILMKAVADESCAITVFSLDAKQKIAQAYPELAARVHVIPQSIWLPNPTPENSVMKVSGCPKILLPAGLRPVKDVFYLWDALLELRKHWPEMSFSIIGAKLDKQVSREVEIRTKQFKWFHYLGEVPLEKMADIYKQIDIVLNTSKSEGQPTSLLEAMYIGKPVVAKRIPGNESIICHGENGLLFDSPYEFLEQVKTLLASPSTRERIIAAGREYVKEHDLTKEVGQYTSVYTHCMNKASQSR
ncbi:glycosyltransferase [Halalkalibacter urbisdiaboli]|uniref:glycosyltransferase n=1 Tax=Halalkalibacter urbisdiaboli TaxID=1960589 RepID=UPI0013FDBC13|nr:glycosyltransferase [Halalkalibacter urbisdiaboli]